MDAETDTSGRVAYSFPSGTFDLLETHGNRCLASEDGTTTYVGLRPPWPRLFETVRQLHVVLGAAASGPLSLADTWEYPALTPIPGAGFLFDVDTGTEIHWHHLASAIAVVDDHGSQQTASLQFFDRQGKGCLKLMLTNFSNLDAFDRLLGRFAIPFDSGTSGENSEKAAREDMPAPKMSATELVSLWSTLGRTRPDTLVAGTSTLWRRAALDALPSELNLAWQCQSMTVMRALELATASHIPLQCSVQNQATQLRSVLRPTHWHPCEAGLTFFSPYSQLTLRHSREAWEVWATRYQKVGSNSGADAGLKLEIYGENGHLCGVLEPAAEAKAKDVVDWNALLKSYRA
ncbi:MAG: hypothetical protein ACAI34_01200 [Verrucomicrobium sp.]|nr:hypothetical protein [Verrucomicrobium sp.]